MKAVSVMLWELDDKDLSRLPADFPVLRYDTLHGSVSAIAAQTARCGAGKRYVYLLYKLPSAIPATGDSAQPCGAGGATQ